MNHDPQSRVEKFNALVRGACVLILLAGFVFAFVFDVVAGGQRIDAATYVAVLTVALTWWFKSRDEEKAAQHKREEAVPPPVPQARGNSVESGSMSKPNL